MAENPLTVASKRLFLAIPLHESFSQEVRSLLELVGRKIPDVKWVRPEQVHLTLHFFGSTPESEIEKIDRVMKQIASRFKPISVALDQIGGFPSLRQPHVIWLGVQEKTGQLLSLYERIQQGVQHLGFEVENRPFHPHVTLGRAKKRTNNSESLLSKLKLNLPTQEKIFESFGLYQSHCLPEGARYEILKSYSLSSKP